MSGGWDCRPPQGLTALERTSWLAGYSDGFHGLHYGAGYDDPAPTYRYAFDKGRSDASRGHGDIAKATEGR